MRVTATVHSEPRTSVEEPGYRVNFWERSGDAWLLDAYALTDVEDVAEVLCWVDETGRGRRVEVFAEMDREAPHSFQTPRGTGLIRLLGSNPNLGESVLIGAFLKE